MRNIQNEMRYNKQNSVSGNYIDDLGLLTNKIK